MLRICLSMIFLSGCSVLFEQEPLQDAGTDTIDSAVPIDASATDADPSVPDANPSVPDANPFLIDAGPDLVCSDGFTVMTPLPLDDIADISFTADTPHTFVAMHVVHGAAALPIQEVGMTSDPPNSYTWNYQFKPDQVGIYDALFTRRDSSEGPEIEVGQCSFLVAQP